MNIGTLLTMNSGLLSGKVIDWNPKEFAVKQNFNKVISENGKVSNDYYWKSNQPEGVDCFGRALGLMQAMDKDAYAEYQKMGQNDDGGLSALKYLTNWYAGAVKKDPSMVDNYEKQSEEYVEKNVNDRELVDILFEGITD